MKQSIEWLDNWLQKVGTEPTLHRALVKYALGRGADSMKDIMCEEGIDYRDMRISQGFIGWIPFMDGMISKETFQLWKDFVDLGGCRVSLDK